VGNEEYGSQRKNSLLFFYQPEITGPEPVIDNYTLDLSLSDRIAKTIFSMRITMIIYAGTIYKICLAINAYSEIATLPWKSQLALATGGLYDGDLLCGIGLARNCAETAVLKKTETANRMMFFMAENSGQMYGSFYFM